MKRFCASMLLVVFVLGFVHLGFVRAEEDVQDLKAQVLELMKRIEQIEQQQLKQKDEITKSAGSRVDLSNTLSKLKLKGRFAAGYFDSEKSGSYPSGSFEIPDAKIQFSFQADDINTLVLRFNLNNAARSISTTSPLLDYYYLQSKDFLPFLKDTPFSLSGRLGRFKLGFGEETWTDNMIEGILPSNSAAKAGVTDEGAELAGKIKLDNIGLKPLGWVVSVSNATAGIGSDNNNAKAFMGKLYYTPLDSLYLSASYYDSGDLVNSDAEMSIGGLISAPSGANNWKRKVWEADARYDFGKGKKPLEPIVYSDSKAIVRLSYGGFHDIATTAVERSGYFSFIDGIYNLTKKYYTAGRYSFVDLDSDTTATLNGVTANRYERYSFGLGYRWSENTILKLSYDWNRELGSNTNSSKNNLVSAIVASQF